MKKIKLTPYKCHLPELVEMQKNLLELLFVLPVAPRDLIKKAALADRIEAATGEYITLEDSEHNWLLDGLEATKIKERQFVEFVRRILDAETVEIKN